MNNPRLPQYIAGFNAFLDGDSFFGVIEEGTLPKFTVKVEDFQAGTGMAPVAIGLGYESMQMEFTVAEVSEAVLLRLNKRCQLVFRGSIFVSDCVEVPFVITQTGLLKEVDLGSVKKGDMSGKTKFVHTVDRITIERRGKELIHIDNINGIERIDGVECTAARRVNLGVV